MRIEPAKNADTEELVRVWEAAVRKTHHFLAEADIVRFREQLPALWLPHVEVVLALDENGAVAGFLGLARDTDLPPERGRIEMLFVKPERHGQGVGRALLDYAKERFSFIELDVNEQNPGACRFYEACGFSCTGRSPVDGQGNPFPLRHMRWSA